MRLASGPGFEQVNEKLSRYGLNTVCTSARCPNLSDCWNRGTATFMILGNICTRHCRFCSVGTGDPHGEVDETEPERVAEAVRDLGLKYVVLTSVDRDDLDDLGAGVFARTVDAVRKTGTREQKPQIDTDGHRVRKEEAGRASGVRVEVLTPDFGGQDELIRQVVDAGPDVFGHNIETVERVSPVGRDHRASYRRSLEVLACVKRQAPELLTKSGIMVGLGETDDEVTQTLRDLRSVGCDIVTIGQYLQPDRRCVLAERYVEPVQFERWQQQALDMGFRAAFCGPLVRSSYHAEDVFPDAGPDRSSSAS